MMSFRGENPVGEWKIKVADQNTKGLSGIFHGWSMTLWGSTIDPSLVRNYDLPMLDALLPPLKTNVDPPVITATSTKTHPKPTAHLPGDHGTAEGENDKPAFPDQGGAKTNNTGPPSSNMTPTPDEGWFPSMSGLVRKKKWFFGAVGTVLLFGVAAGLYFWRRRALSQRRDA